MSKKFELSLLSWNVLSIDLRDIPFETDPADYERWKRNGFEFTE